MRAALAALPGVRQIDIEFEKQQVVVTVDEASLDEQKLIGALEDAGFGGSVLEVKTVGPADSQPSGNGTAPEESGQAPSESDGGAAAEESEANRTDSTSDPFGEHVTVHAYLDRDRLRPGDAFRVAVVIDIDEGWHIYGNPVGPGIGRPTVVSAEVPNGFHVDSVRYAPGEKAVQDLGETDTSWVWEHTGRVIHYLSGSVAEDAAPGDYQWSVQASAQACTETACFPGKVTIDLPVTVAAKGEPAASINQELFEGFDAAKTPSAP